MGQLMKRQGFRRSALTATTLVSLAGFTQFSVQPASAFNRDGKSNDNARKTEKTEKTEKPEKPEKPEKTEPKSSTPKRDDDDDHHQGGGDDNEHPTTQPVTTVAAVTTVAPVTTVPAVTTKPAATTKPAVTTKPAATTTKPTTTVPMPTMRASAAFVTAVTGSPLSMSATITNTAASPSAVTVLITMGGTSALPHYLEAKGTSGTWTCSAYVDFPKAPQVYTCTGTVAGGTSGVIAVSSGSKVMGTPGQTITANVVINPSGVTAGAVATL
jgi:hypothetical protein